MQAPIGPKLISTVTIHTHLFVMLKIGKLNNLQHETTQVSQLFYLLHLENQARKLQTPNLILLFLLSATAVPNSHFFCFQLLRPNRFNKSCLWLFGITNIVNFIICPGRWPPAFLCSVNTHANKPSFYFKQCDTSARTKNSRVCFFIPTSSH